MEKTKCSSCGKDIEECDICKQSFDENDGLYCIDSGKEHLCKSDNCLFDRMRRDHDITEGRVDLEED